MAEKHSQNLQYPNPRTMYVLDYKRQVELIKEMEQLRKDDDKWEAYYHHPSTNEMWKSFFPKANGEKRGPKIMRLEPVPEKLEERLKFCLNSNNSDNAIGLAVELSVDPEKWNQIISIVEENYRNYNSGQLRTFVKRLGILDYKEMFEELNYTPQQFNMDEQMMKKLIWRARKVLFKNMVVFW